MNHEGLKDSEFETQYRSCQQALDAEHKAKADADRQRRRRLLFGLRIAAATLVLVLACGLIIRSSMRATADRVAKADAALEAARVEAARIEAARVEAARVEAALEVLIAAELERVEAASVLNELPPSVLAASAPFKNSAGMSFKLLPYGPDGSISIGVYEVTQQQYEEVMGSNPSEFKGANNPVEQVSWDDAVAYCAKLSSLPAEVAAGRVYRLPTEAEWEYACRAGATTKYSFGDDEKDLGKYAWFSNNSGETTHAVGEKLPNGWGLYDMHGNVSEWCSDAAGSNRVNSGGCWGSSAKFCRSAFGSYSTPSFRGSRLGFRLALSYSGIPQ
jgi:hypothetical protein